MWFSIKKLHKYRIICIFSVSRFKMATLPCCDLTRAKIKRAAFFSNGMSDCFQILHRCCWQDYLDRYSEFFLKKAKETWKRRIFAFFSQKRKIMSNQQRLPLKSDIFSKKWPSTSLDILKTDLYAKSEQIWTSRYRTKLRASIPWKIQYGRRCHGNRDLDAHFFAWKCTASVGFTMWPNMKSIGCLV